MEYLDYEDILIMPSSSSKINSRADVSLVNNIGHVPICAANMKNVGTLFMGMELQKHKMLTFITKDTSLREWIVNIKDINFNYIIPTFGITDNDIVKFEEMFVRFGNKLKYVCIDVANGHMESVIDVYKHMQSLTPKTKFIVGNIANKYTMESYEAAGIWACKVGIGSGSVCTTRLVTGIGVPQASLIQELVEFKTFHKMDIKIISDGGIKTIGDMTKSLVIGADYVMCGGMFAGYDEGYMKRCPFEGDIKHEGGALRTFQGSSSVQTKDYVTPEGKIVNGILPKGSVETLCKNIKGGLRSAGSYLGKDLSEFNTCHKQIISVRRQVNDKYGKK